MSPCIITVAITGSLPNKSHNPAVPLSVSEQIESAHESYEAGAALVHIHVRDDAGQPCSDPDRFARVQEGIRQHCPGMIVQFSTGGRGRKPEERGSMLHLKPDMASLATGSVNFPSSIYENPPDLIDSLAARLQSLSIKPEVEVFDLSMLYKARQMVSDGQLDEPVHVQFVFGLKNAMPARKPALEFMVSELGQLLPGATWTAAGIGRCQLEVNHWALELGGHCRTGFEDNVRYDRTRLAVSNAELVRRVAHLAAEYDRYPAKSEEARQLLSLPAVA